MNQDLKKKLILFGGIGVGLLVVVILIALLINVFSGEKKSYASAEDTLKQAAIEYYKVHDYLLPGADGEEKVVTDKELVESKFMNDLSTYVPKGATCTAKVLVKKSGETYSYTPYLDCGKDYYSIQLYKSLLDPKNIVTSGDGLYQMNGEYVYRGEKVNNYVKFDNKNWRVVRITAQNQIVLIYDRYDYKTIWDDRYNDLRRANSGINDYLVSRLKDYMGNLYNDSKFLSNTAKEKLDSYDLCIGKRSDTDQVNDGSIECAQVLKDQKIGLLPVYQYINASLDPVCQSVEHLRCQNYNYLSTGDETDDWWTITATSENTYGIYAVNYNGTISYSEGRANAYARPVVYLNSNAMQLKGNGTKENPYIVK